MIGLGGQEVSSKTMLVKGLNVLSVKGILIHDGDTSTIGSSFHSLFERFSIGFSGTRF